MKKMKIFAAIAIAMMMSISASAKDIIKYHTDDSNHQYQVTYTLDDQERVVTKVIKMRANDKWTPLYAYSMFYGDEESTITYAAWDAKTHTYTRHAQQIRYKTEDCGTLMTVAE